MNWKKNYAQKIKEFTVIAHFCTIILALIGLVSYLDFDTLSKISYKIFYYICTLFVVLLLGLIYLDKTFIKSKLDIKRNLYSYAFNTILFFLISFIVGYTGHEDSLFEMLFILPVITTSITHGVKPGLIFAFIESTYIIYYHKAFIANNYLDISIINAGILFLTAWLIGSFAELEMKTKKMLEVQANMDGLTELSNHRYFQEALKNKISEASINDSSVSLIFIDIDYFKYYNDMFGHQRGDEILKRIGGIISKHLPPECIAARYGGDEFAVILPSYSSQEAAEIAEEIRSQVEKTQFYKEDHLPNNKITLSLGVAAYPENAKTQSELINAADEALYKAKYMDKNKVKLYFSVLDDIKTKLHESENELTRSLRTFLSIINARDRYTYGHSERVMEYAVKIANAMQFNEEEKNALKYGAFLHDIGKIEIDREILNKPGKLSDHEIVIMKQHPLYGAAMIKPITFLSDCVDTILYHHENLDGSGYPEGLKGEEIPLGARILRVIDSYDAMVTDRPYRSGMSTDEALAELKKYSGKYYDPEIVEIFTELFKDQLCEWKIASN